MAERRGIKRKLILILLFIGALGLTLGDQAFQSTKVDISSIYLTRNPINDASNQGGEVAEPSEEAPVFEEPEDCRLDDDQVKKHYDPTTRQWIVTDDFFEELKGKLGYVFDCASYGDVIVFKTSKPLKPQKKITINKKITIAAYSKNADYSDLDSIPESDQKAIFTCPSDSEGLFSLRDEVNFVNVVIQDCNQKIDAPVAIEGCQPDKAQKKFVMRHVEFRRNNRQHGTPSVMTAGPSCSTLDLASIKIKENTCNGTMIGVIDAGPGTKIVARNIDASDNVCTVFVVESADIDLTDSDFSFNAGVIMNDKNEARGAAIRLSKNASGNIRNSRFWQNRANRGGSISLTEASKLIADNLHISDHYSDAGGGIHIDNSELDIKNSVFLSNEVEIKGGAISCMNFSKLDAANITVEGNKATSGAGIMFQECTGVIKDSVFKANHITTGNSTDDGKGAAFYLIEESVLQASRITCQDNYAKLGACGYVQESELTMTDSLVDQNHATAAGGGLLIARSNATITGSQLSANHAPLGAALSLDIQAKALVDNCQFEKNTASEKGGAVLIVDRSLATLQNSNFQSNKANFGGAIFAENVNPSILNCTLESNEAATCGGGLYLTGCPLVATTNLSAISNVAAYGGGLFATGSRLEVYNADVRNNRATSIGGGVVLNTNTKMTGDSITFINNTAVDTGGLAAFSKSKVELNRTLFINNVDTKKAGAVLIDGGWYESTDLTLEGNRGGLAGAILSKNSEISISNGNSMGNQAGSNGGVISAIDSKVDLVKMIIRNNSAAQAGGGISLSKTILKCRDVSFKSNIAFMGGGLFAESSVEIDLQSVLFEEGEAMGGGGAIAVTNNSTLTASEVAIKGNKAGTGGGILSNQSSIQMDNVTLLWNSANSGNGGAISAEGGQMDVCQTTLQGNLAAESGGGLSLDAVEVAILRDLSLLENEAGGLGGGIHGRNLVIDWDFISFSDNKAANGGAIAFEAVGADLTNLDLRRNSATQRAGGGGKGGALYLADDSNVQGLNLTCEDNQAYSGGCTYCQESQLRLKSCNATSNKADQDGGAIYLTTSIAHLSQIHLYSNAASNGGCLALDFQSSVIATGVKIADCKATNTGGGLYLSAQSQLEATNVSIRSNWATSGGGFFAASSSHVSIKSGSFEENQATQVGGAFFSSSSDLLLNETTFSYNKATKSGGGILTDSSTLGGESLHFLFNTANSSGALTITKTCEARIHCSSFRDNEGGSSGGAVTIEAAYFHGDDLMVVGNRAETGGGFYSTDSHIDLTNSTFSENRATAGRGGAMDASKGTIEMADIVISHNTASEDGGGFRLEDQSQTQLNNLTFRSNSASNSGGGVYSDNAQIVGHHLSFYKNEAMTGGGTALVGGNVEVRDLHFEENTATLKGGALASDNTFLTMTRLFVVNNKAMEEAGGLYANSGMVSIVDSVVKDNSAARGGGFSGIGSSVMCSDTVFEANSAQKGGAVRLSESTMAVTNISFEGNSVENESGEAFGGAVYLDGNSGLQADYLSCDGNLAVDGGCLFVEKGTVWMTNSKMRRNSASSRGGAMHIGRSEGELEDTVVEDNSAKIGGGLFLVDESDFKVSNCRIERNTARQNGGGLVIETGSAVKGKSMSFVENVGQIGGAMAVRESNVTLKDSEFLRNGANETGGALVLNEGRLVGKGLIIEDSYAEYGAGLSATESEIEIDGGNISRNQASDGSGGAIHIVGGSMKGSNLTFSDNAATQDGAAVSLTRCIQFAVASSIFEGNAADGNGGAVHLAETKVEYEDVHFVKNIAEVGAAVYLVRSKGDFVSCHLRENVATQSAGALMSNSSNLKMHSGSVSNNLAASNGGGLALFDSDLEISDLLVESNTAAVGGGLTLHNSQSDLTGVTFKGNKAVRLELPVRSLLSLGSPGVPKLPKIDLECLRKSRYDEGCLYVEDSPLRYTDSDDIADLTSGTGGAVFMLSSTIRMSSSDIKENEAESGAALSLHLNSAASLIESVVEFNVASRYGGAVLVTSQSELHGDDLLFQSNVAAIGGAMAIQTGSANLKNTSLLSNSAIVSDADDGRRSLGGSIFAVKGSKVEGHQMVCRSSAADSGGCVFVQDSDLTLVESNFDSNTATIGGGGVYLSSASAYISGTAFSINKAAGGHGGAIACHLSTDLLIEDSVFSENTAIMDGAAISVRMSSGLVVSGSSLKANSANHGGAINLADSVASLKSTRFEGNKAMRGGAVHLWNSSVSESEDLDFVANKADLGGAVYLFGANLTQTGGGFEKNEAEHGGALHITAISKAVLESVSVRNNSGAGTGGGILLDGMSNLDFKGGEIRGNQAGGVGGALAAFQSTLNAADLDVNTNEGQKGTGGFFLFHTHSVVLDSVFSENIADEGEGGAIYSYDSSFEGHSLSFYFNRARSGGALFMNKTANTSIKNSSFTSNSAPANGGAFAALDSEIEIHQVEFVDNEANSGGGLCLVSSNANMSECEFRGNKATDGGGISLRNASSTVIRDSVAVSNSARASGGAIIVTSDSDLTAQGLNCDSNSAKRGGALVLQGTRATVTDSIFTSNAASVKNSNQGSTPSMGGALLLEAAEMKATGLICRGNTAQDGGCASVIDNSGAIFSGSTINSNAADEFGGAISLIASTAEVSESEISGNNATFGGAMSMHRESFLDLSDSTLASNKADKWGGGLFLMDESSLSASSVLVQYNYANEGGGFHLNKQSKTTLSDIVFEGNEGGQAGGGLFFQDTEIKGATKLNFTANQAQIGAGLFGQNGKAELVESVFKSNEALREGGAVCLKSNGALNLSQGYVENNGAPQGGGISVGVGSIATLIDSIMRGNKGGRTGGAVLIKMGTLEGDRLVVESNESPVGGGIYCSEGKINLVESRLVENNASDGEGGGLYASSGVMAFDGLIVDRNKAKAGAGFSIFSARQCTLVDSTFSENEADLEGGGIKARGGVIKCQELQFVKNKAATGGGIDLQDILAEVKNSEFAQNEATSVGGGLNVDGSILFYGLVVKGNSAKKRGGGLHILSDKNVDISNSTFAANTVAKFGGGIYYEAPSISLNHLLIEGNKAESGGGVYSNGGTAELTNMTLSSNVATEAGGALFAHEIDLTASNITVKGNSATNGAGFHFGSNSHIEITSSDFILNMATETGGAIRSQECKTFTAIDLILDGNEAALGGGLHLFEIPEVDISSSVISQNKAEENGGGLHVTKSKSVVLKNMTLRDNKADYGAAYFFEEVSCEMADSVFEGNVAGRHGGGVMAMVCHEMKMSSLNFTNNEAGFGGACYFQESKVDLADCNLIGNKVNDAGGAISAIMSTVLTGSRLSFLNNEGTFGGALYASENTVNFSNSTFEDNVAKYDGGAVFASSEAVLMVTDVVLKGNRASMGGAVRTSYKADATFVRSVFRDNSAEESGGAVSASFTPHIAFQDCIIESNTASQGGAAFFKEVSGAKFVGTQISLNEATDGGAFYLVRNSAASVSGVNLTSNKASNFGGAVHSIKSAFSGESSIVQGNKAVSGGSVYAIKDSAISVKDTTFHDNRARTRGGGIYFEAKDKPADFYIENSKFTENQAKFGGALHFVREQSLEIQCADSFEGDCKAVQVWNSVFQNNIAAASGAIGLLSDPYSFIFTCQPSGESPEIQTLIPLAQGQDHAICPTWTGNVVPDRELKTQEFGSYAENVNVQVTNDRPTNRQSNADEGVLVLDDIVSGWTLPQMDLKSVDAFGNELNPDAEDLFWAKLVAPNDGFFKHGREVGVQVIDGRETFSDVPVIAPPGTYNLTLVYGNSIMNASVPVVAHIGGCPEGLFMGPDDTCHPCGHGEYSRDGKCVKCPEGAVCSKQFVLPEGGRWQKTPCHTRTQKCLYEAACTFPHRTEELKNFTDGLRTCDLNEDEANDYGDLQCDEVSCGSVGACKVWLRGMGRLCAEAVMGILDH